MLKEGSIIIHRTNLEWKPITGYENQYEVSNYGDFHILAYSFIDKANRRINRKEKYIWAEELKEYGGSEDQGRYLGVHLGGMRKTYAHILVAQEFCPNPDNKPEVNHKDGNTKNNYGGCAHNNYLDSNLEWVTRKENMEHASANGLINHESLLRKLQCARNRKKINYDVMKRPIYQLDLSGSIVELYDSITAASKSMNLGKTIIGSVARNDGKHKTAGGFNWVFKDEYEPDKDYTVIVDRGAKARKPIIQKTLNGEIVAEYTSIQEACRLTGFPGSSYIGECCAGKRKYYKNFIWEFKNNYNNNQL